MTVTLPRILPSPDGKPAPPQGTATAFRTFAHDPAAGRRPWTAEAARVLSDLFDQLLAAEQERDRTRSEKGIRRGGRPLKAAA
ncbi:hypothetical protein ABZV67_15215 [Streptomyces sp. NPDC005065]|uniref:hypothetical protein n=1 Tax=unclassified Streptomyces TaxID=2593676 RepID=UPI0033BA9968